MKRTHSLFPLAIFILIIFLLWQTLHHSKAIASPLINKPVPSFQGTELQYPNREVTEQSLLGQVSLINIWASWCEACREELPVLKEISRQGKVAMYGVAYKDDRSEVKAWLKRYGNPYTKVIYDPTGQIGSSFGAYATPETFIVDKQGIIRYKYIGALSLSVWRQELLPKIEALNHGSNRDENEISD